MSKTVNMFVRHSNERIVIFQEFPRLYHKHSSYTLTPKSIGTVMLAATLNRAARMWEDTITLSPILGGWEVEGLTRDLVRVIGSVEQYFRNHGKD